MAELHSNSAQPTLLDVEGQNTDVRTITNAQKRMSTFGQDPSQQDAKLPNQPNEIARTRRLSAERRWRNPLYDDTKKSESSRAQGRPRCLKRWQPRCLNDLYRVPNWEVPPHGWFAEELLICPTDVCLCGDIPESVPAEQVCVLERKSACLDKASVEPASRPCSCPNKAGASTPTARKGVRFPMNLICRKSVAASSQSSDLRQPVWGNGLYSPGPLSRLRSLHSASLANFWTFTLATAS